MIRLEQARAIITATRAKGHELHLNPLTAAVLDAGGHLVAMEREDGSAFGRPAIAEGKAVDAKAMVPSSWAVVEFAADRPQFMAALSAAWDGKVIPAAGGVLVRGADGTLLGAVGVTGDLSDKDEQAAIAGIEAAGLLAG